MMTALEELSLLDDALDGAVAEAKLASLWHKTFTVAAAAKQAWLEQAVVRRGRAVVETIYPDAEERRRLYQYGFSPYGFQISHRRLSVCSCRQRVDVCSQSGTQQIHVRPGSFH
ncbi:hypothetical protein SB394_01180 [Burkholderia sp. BCCIQ04A]|uniref:hypothetical protein n=1 Tax=Burkholderia TaxID=32008 RepID=UPI001C52B772|nr:MULTISPECIES: hypothetical protein [Burkholderia]MEB2529897.1 hypothetical protein [Burkholderia anthinoferrum]MEB2632336.1 hypothetical protein [Burkholderia anthinoferrum]